MTDNRGKQYPEQSGADLGAELVKVAMGKIPVIGSFLVPFMETAHSQRVEEFHRQMGKRVVALEINDTSSLAARAKNGDQGAREKILSTYLLVLKLAQEAMDEEKREFLASAMASTLAWDASSEEMERRYFLRCLADFEFIHIQLLRRAPKGQAAIRELWGSEGLLGEIAKTAWEELNDRKMVNLDSPATMMTPAGASADRLTERGRRFLEFIEYPSEKGS